MFEHAALCERMRVDRNGSVLSILLIRPGGGDADAIDHLGAALSERLRLTDTVGRVRDGRLGILLPDTNETGAWKVARDLSTLLGEDDDHGPPAFEVVVYPDPQSDEPWGSDTVHDRQPVDVAVASGSVSSVERVSSVEGASSIDGASPVDRLFARPTPWWKRSTDLLVGGALLLVASPVIAVCAGAVALTSPGGPFFAQHREGLGGRRFKMYKIRTMRVGAEDEKRALRDSSEQDGPAFKMTVDPRVTPIGRVLRMLSLDELPQLINVLRGEMSLVGPRPLPVDESRQCEPWQRQRLTVTPGITCIWQVRGRSVVSFDEWIRMDLDYIRRRSPWQDFKLLLETGPSLLNSKGPR